MAKFLAAILAWLTRPGAFTTYTGNYCAGCGRRCWDRARCYSCSRRG